MKNPNTTIVFRFTRFAFAATLAISAGCGPAIKKPQTSATQESEPQEFPGETGAKSSGKEPLAQSNFEAQSAFLAADLDSYLYRVKRDPGNSSSEQVTRHVWNALKDQNLLSYWPIMSIELDAMGKLSQKERPAFIDAHPRWLSKGPGQWLIGQHMSSPQSGFSVPALKGVVNGTDLGISVGLGDKTLFYFGDTAGKRSPIRCVKEPASRCDDAIAVSYDTNFEDGLDLYVFTEKQQRKKGFVPFFIPGIHESASGNKPIFGAYNTPTGAAAISNAPFWPDGSVVVVWYGTSSRPPPGRNDQASWVGCSANGLHFDSCYGSSGAPVPFSRRKFIQVAPVPITRDDIAKVCADDSGSYLCSLPSWNTGQGGLLLFGAGGHYRCSSLYLAYIPTEQIGSVHSVAGETVPFVHYFTGNGWSEEEEDAKAVIAIDEKRCSNVGTDKEALWCYPDENNRCMRHSGKGNAFGEISVKPIREGADGKVPFLVLLSNHAGLPVLYRTASLSHPERWSAPQPTNTAGYGPYIIEKSIRVQNGRLHLYHVVSSWGGPRGKTPYGVYTELLRIMVNGEAVLPPWPPGE